MITETAVSMMVLAMNIRRDGPADSDVFSSRNNGRKEAARQQERDNVDEQHAGLRGQKSCFRIKSADAVESSHLHGLTVADSSVSVGTSVSSRYSTHYSGRRDACRFRGTGRQ
jgi:hypothetical protein